MRTLVIGGGAAGVCAAICAARRGEEVILADRNRRLLKKVGVSGNGRGNLLNGGAPVYYGDTDFAMKIMERMPCGQIRGFLEELGLTLTEEEAGRIYPASLSAAAAVDAFQREIRRLGITVAESLAVTSLTGGAGGFTAGGLQNVYAPDTLRKSGKAKPGELLSQTPVTLRADRVILASGGAAAPVHGTDGTAYGLLLGFGHTLETPRPALCPLLTDTGAIRGLEGQRVRTVLRLTGVCEKMQSEGEALFTEDGVSGIAAMQLSREAEPGDLLHMDLRRAVFGGDCDQIVFQDRVRRFGGECLSEFWTGAASRALGRALLQKAGLWEQRERPVRDMDMEPLWRTVCDFTLPVTGTRGFDAAQVTAGGISCGEFSPETMESRLCGGLYAAGELLNVDGPCGGYNLMFAFATGILAGSAGGRN